MARPDFSSTWAKIERAKEHRDGLERHIADHFNIESNRPRCVGKYDPDCGCHIYRVSWVPPNLGRLQTDVSLTVGDIAHNLRSALDHLAYQLALVEARRQGSRLTPSDRRGIYFPIHTRYRGSWPNVGWINREQTYVGRFGVVNAAILKSFQPFRGLAGRPDSWSGPYRHQLTRLNALSSRDKHRLPNVIAAIPNNLSWRAGTPDFDTTYRYIGSSAPRVVLGAEAMRIRHLGAGVDGMEVEAEVRPHISLGNRGTVWSDVDRLATFVVEIVRAFDPIP